MGDAQGESKGTPIGELAEFVNETLSQIAIGVSAAQELFESLGGQVNPAGALEKLPGTAVISVPNNREAYVQTVDFDIAVARIATGTDKIGGGIKVLSLSAGGDHENSIQQSNASRIKFSLPVVLPAQPNLKTESERDQRTRDTKAALDRFAHSWRTV